MAKSRRKRGPKKKQRRKGFVTPPGFGQAPRKGNQVFIPERTKAKSRRFNKPPDEW